MENEDMIGCEGWHAKETILAALALLDERGTNREVTLAMAIVKEGFTADEKGDYVSSYELVQRALWADSISARQGTQEDYLS